MPKRKSNKQQRLEEATQRHEKWLESMGYKGGKCLLDKHGRRVGINDLPDLTARTKNYPLTSDRIAGNGNKKKQQQYTGDYVKGIATTHKSNIVPVTSRQQAVEAAQMRRS